MNVLICSASRKVSLVQAFQRALAAEGGGRVVAADCEPASAALHLADRARVVPRTSRPEFLDALVRVCREEEIGLIIPTRDEELPLFAERRLELESLGLCVPVSSPQAIGVCQNKAAFAGWCLDHGFAVPPILNDSTLSRDERYPVFARALAGKKSATAFKVGSRAELLALRQRHGPLLVQELVEAPEYSLDVLSDLSGRVLSVVPRRREVIVGGESFASCTVREPELLQVGAQVAQALGLVGPSVIQAFVRQGRVELIEVNPRFGGASALAFAAGADAPRCLVQMARGQRVVPFLGGYRDGLRMLRYTQEVYVDAA